MCRLLLALTFLFSGTVKLIDPRGFQYKLEDYATEFGVGNLLPPLVSVSLAVTLAMVEFLLGVYLFFGIRRKATAVATLAFMLVYTPLTLYIAVTNVVVDCGCFGDAVVLTNWQTFGKNAILLLAAVTVLWHSKLMTRFISERNQWTISIYSIAFSLALALYCIYRLPIIDFRPFHAGVDLPKAIAREWEGTDATQNYADFSISTPEGEDITMEWLEQEGYKFILVSPYIETADDGAIDDINNVYEYCQEHGYPFLCLTSSSEKSIDRWKDMTGAEYPFALTDGATLKTVIRSNPGLLLLKDGVIINKWPNTALPNREVLTAPLDDLSIGRLQSKSHARSSLGLLLWFFVPLVVFALTDRIWAGCIYLIERRYTKHKTEEEK